MNRRRFILIGAAAAVSPAIAYAQTAPVPECAIGFVNGLLTMSPDCPLLTPPGLDAGIAPPSHLTMAGEAEATAADAEAAAQTAADEEELRRQEQRDRKHDKKTRRRDGKHDKRGRATDRQQRKRENRQDRDERKREAAEIDGCEDFDSYEEAQEFFDSVGYDRVNDPFELDRDFDTVACNEQGSAPDIETEDA